MNAEIFLDLFEEIKKHRKPKKEKNLFSLGGKGHYENPITDLLAFYLDTSEDHGLGGLVLSSLLECIPDYIIAPPFDLEDPPEREYVTLAQNRIDLVLNGGEWMVALENKIEHGPVNPFLEYRDSIDKDSRFVGKKKIFVILSPYDPKIVDWVWIDYRRFINLTKKRLGDFFVVSGSTKWSIFLRELILNIESQLGEDMDNKTLGFVKDNYALFVESIALHNQYVQSIRKLSSEVAKIVYGDYPASVRENDWGEAGIALRIFPLQDRIYNTTLLLRPDGKFRVQFYVEAKKIKAGVERTDFTKEGIFDDWGSELKGELWLFAKDDENLDEALKTLEYSLTILRDNTDN